jgi:hypothetical protein
MSYCSFLAIEVGGLTHWCGYDCDGEAWVQVCTRDTINDAGTIRDLPVMPLCSVCLASSDVEVLA